MLAPSGDFGQGVSMARFPLERYAATIATHAPVATDLSVTETELKVADLLNQLIEFPGGFVAYFRCAWSSVPLFRDRQWDKIFALPVPELTNGPVLYVAETLALKSGEIGRILFALARLPGVEAWAAHRNNGRRWALKPIRQRVYAH